MEITKFIQPEQRDILEKARQTYGDTAQILVANEELCELAAVCAKYPRYENRAEAQEKLYVKALDEVADVIVVLDHIVSIFNLSEEDIENRVSAKIERLNRWLSSSSSMDYTTKDRYVKSSPDCFIPNCTRCKKFGKLRNIAPGQICSQCLSLKGKFFDPVEE